MSEIVLLGKTYTVRRATLADALRRGRLMREVDASEFADEDTRGAATLYPPLAACTIDAPSLEGFLGMPDTETDTWFLAVKAENPHWFPAAQDESGPNA